MSNLIYLLLGTSSMVLMMVAIIWFVFAFQRKLAAKAKAYKEIEELMQKQELKSAYVLIEAQEQERKRIAAELHDNVGSLLATLKIYSDLSVTHADPDYIKELNGKMNVIAEDLGLEIRKLSHKLDLRALSGFGLKAALLQLAEAINESGKLKVLAVIDIASPLPEEISLQLYRIIQELFTNTLKHAMASEARIEITVIDRDVTLIYEDNGKGFDINDQASMGMGISNIKSRVGHINGKLTFDSLSNGITYIIEITNYG
ncbi:sensor histidine kinase [Pedobacter panaciterrae]|jgi:two-component system NarL family sensor kinase